MKKPEKDLFLTKGQKLFIYFFTEVLIVINLQPIQLIMIHTYKFDKKAWLKIKTLKNR